MPTMEKKPQARHTDGSPEARASHVILFTARLFFIGEEIGAII